MSLIHGHGTWALAELGPTSLPFLFSSQTSAKMINDEGQTVDLYIPRKCAWTNKLITAKDHASIQINVGHLNEEGVYDGTFTTFALTGRVRSMGEADAALDLLWKKKQADGLSA